MGIRLTFIVILCTALTGHSQKVGLVLSGGGPRGVTHIGVLKALEEKNIPIDYIAGTSMGAIIGGLYASGYSPEEIEKIFTSNELRSWLSGGNENLTENFFRQEPPSASWQIFKLSYDTIFHAKLPANTINPTQLDFGFMQLFSQRAAIAGYDFDSLYIPFRCIASDIALNQPVVLKNGLLDKSIRASMTFPFYITPVRINNHLMFDGGMYNNFPVDVLTEEFKPDVIIGSKAASNYGPPTEDDIISQIQSMLMANTQYEVSDTNGLLIEPNLWSIGITDFSNTQAFIDSGYVATLRDIDKLFALIPRRVSSHQKNEKRKTFLQNQPGLRIHDVVFQGVSNDQKDYLEKLIDKNTFIQSINSAGLTDKNVFGRIKAVYLSLLGEEQISSAYPELKYTPNGYDLVFNIRAAYRLEAKIGGLISSQSINEIFLQLQYSQWKRKAINFTGNMYLGRFHNSGQLRYRLDIPGRIPFAAQLTYTLNGWNYFNTSSYFFEDENPNYLIQQDNFATFDIGMPIGQMGKIHWQFQNGRKRDDYYQSNSFTRLDTTDITIFDFYSPDMAVEVNSLNRKQYPSKGYMMKVSGRFISGLERTIPGSTSFKTDTATKYHNWFIFRAMFDQYMPLSSKLIIGFSGEVTLSDQEPFGNYTASVLAAPSFEPLPESQTVFIPQFRAYNFMAGGAKLIWIAARNVEFRNEIYGFQPFKEIGKTEENVVSLGKEFSNRYFQFSSRILYHAPFGPISASVNYFERAQQPWFFNISLGYYLFNSRPFR